MLERTPHNSIQILTTEIDVLGPNDQRYSSGIQHDT